MIRINLDPNLIEIGNFAVAWHGVFTAVGILAGAWIAARVMKGFGQSEDVIYDGLIWAVPIAIIGARILHVIGNWESFRGNLVRIFFLTEGGIAVWGAVLGGIVGGLIYFARNRHRISATLGQFADACGLGLLLGMIFGRVGDIINGEHLATPSTLPWSVTYTHPETLGERGLSVHPAVVYEMLWNIGALALLLWLLRRIHVRGVVFWLFLILYSVGRIWTHEFRKEDVAAFGLQEAQLVGVLTILVSVPALLWVWRRGISRLGNASPPATASPQRIEERSRPELAGGDTRS